MKYIHMIIVLEVCGEHDSVHACCFMWLHVVMQDAGTTFKINCSQIWSSLCSAVDDNHYGSTSLIIINTVPVRNDLIGLFLGPFRTEMRYLRCTWDIMASFDLQEQIELIDTSDAVIHILSAILRLLHTSSTMLHSVTWCWLTYLMHLCHITLVIPGVTMNGLRMQRNVLLLIYHQMQTNIQIHIS